MSTEISSSRITFSGKEWLIPETSEGAWDQNAEDEIRTRRNEVIGEWWNEYTINKSTSKLCMILKGGY
jgi:hypothetical protein